MFTFLWRAFWARPDVPLLRLPWNALGVVAAAVAGIWDPNIWLTGGAAEMIYLFTLASHPGFQRWIQTEKLVELRQDTDEARNAMAKQLGGAARQRYKNLEDKRLRIEALYRESAADDLLLDSNCEALRQLTFAFLRLLVAQRNLIVNTPQTDATQLRTEIANLERGVADASATEQVRASKRATLQVLHGRLENVDKRTESLAEIDADLLRIEQSINLALEEASLRGRPTAISTNIDFLSHNLENMDDATYVAPPMEHQ